MTPAFQDEVQLAGWSETHTGGAKVTFWLPDTAALDVFRSLTARKGNTAGHRFACVLVEIGDDEQPVNPGESALGGVETPAKRKGGEWAKLAGMWCSDADFRTWAEVGDAEDAAQFIRELSGISSRADLDHNPSAWLRFDRNVRKPFMEWMATKGISK